MNLKTFFSFNFLKENIRKSKGILAFLLGIIPVINIIYLIVLLNINQSTLFTFNSLSFFTYVGILFIPLGLSLSLFSFLFRKSSVDFILSKPLNRRSLFITNTIGGIFLILLFCLLNALIFGLFGLLFADLIIPFKLILDYFIFWFISYLFMFIVLNLAMILAGNMLTSFVLCACIVLFVPFYHLVHYLNEENVQYYISCNDEYCDDFNYYCYKDQSCEKHLKKNEYQIYPAFLMNYHFTAPLAIANSSTSFYDTISIIKMIVLSIIYIIIGYIAFQKRKMENNITSFKKPLIHHLVKGITLVPICFITYIIIKETDFIGWLIAILTIIIYSIVYDLITRKEMYKPVKSTAISILLFLVFTGGYALNFDVLTNKEKVISHFDKIIVDDMVIQNDSLKKQITSSLIQRNREEDSFYYDIIFIEDNKEYKLGVNVSASTKELLEQEYLKWQEEKIKSFPIQEINNIEYQNIYIPVTNKIKDIILENIYQLNEFNLNDLSQKDILDLYSYQDHTYEKISIPIKISDELYKEVLTYQNKEFIDYLEQTSKNPYFTLNIYESSYFIEEDSYIFDYVINSNKLDFINYLKYDNQIDIDKEGISIAIYDKNVYKVTISDASKFKEEFLQYKKKIEDEEEYQRLLEEYQSQGVEYDYQY